MKTLLVLALTLAPATAFAAVQTPKDMGAGWCGSCRKNYTGASCRTCASGGGSTAGNGQAQIVAGMLGSLFGELLRGDPGRADRLAAEAAERARAYEVAAAEAKRRQNEAYQRLLGQMKLENFDGSGELKLKGVEGSEPGGDAGPALKIGTSAAPNDRDTGDPRVVDLRNYQRAYYVASKPDATPDAIAAAAIGELNVIVPPEDAVPLSGDGLKRFQEANNAYRRSHHDGQKEAEYFNRVQAQREIVGRELRTMKADLERQLAAEKDVARAHERMSKIFAAARAEDEALRSAKMELEARRAREAFDRVRLVAVVRNPKAVETPEEKALRTVDSILALAAKMGWTEAEHERLRKAFDSLGDVPAPDAGKARNAWSDIMLESREREAAARAASPVGPDISASGTQSHDDCAVYALASATGLRYKDVANRAAVFIRQGDWRSAAERVDASGTVLKGLNGGEVVLLAESFGQAEVAPSTEFARHLSEGRPVLLNVVPPSGNVGSGHQVVLSRTYASGGKTWFEMIDSNTETWRRRHLTLEELILIAQERGIVYRSPEQAVPMLLREAGK
jgi:hypothetical protein